MDDSRKILYCSLPRCQTANPLTGEFCSRCQTPLIKPYLWVLGTSLQPELMQSFLGGRYLAVSNKLVLDTQPGRLPDIPHRIPSAIQPYLRLIPYRLHIPKVYGIIPSPDNQSDIWLLEYENLSSGVKAELVNRGELPALTEVWQQASGTRQLNWLLQLSQLWQPLQAQGVAETLTTPGLIRVNGRVIQLQELQPDRQPVTLQDLGQLWSGWIAASQPEIQSFLQKLCNGLIGGELNHSEELMRWLEQGLAEVARSQSLSYQIAAASDAGPSRSHNEDAYYQQQNFFASSTKQQALAIVCDGVGGHHGGEVASNLAVKHLPQQLKQYLQQSPNFLTEPIEEAVSSVNDLICRENDSDNRKAQQRMGTTLVMALAHDHEMYLTHIGDSRIYLITRCGCYQLTLDDDLASRQTRLGHALYREAMQQPGAGALVQALGMNKSNVLHPTTQRFVIDEDCVLLLCSDGLSDNGLVEQYWEQEILPILDKQKDLNQAAQELIQLANRLNGHDNVTVALMHCLVHSSADRASPLAFQNTAPRPSSHGEENMKTLQPQAIGKQKGGAGLLLLIMALMVGGMSVAYWYIPMVRQSLDQFQQIVQEKLMEKNLP